MSAPAPIEPPTGRWWCAYEDGCVWPCEVLSLWAGLGGGGGAVTIRPLAPAPDEGIERTVHRSAVYDSRFNHPTYAK